VVVVHLTSSTFFGGPERQMLGLARGLAREHRTVFLSFAEGRRCDAFLSEARRQGFEAASLAHDTPHLGLALRELFERLRGLGAGVLCCHGYKADLLGRPAARRVRIPAVAVSRGWTGETAKVRAYDALDRLHLRWMDRVVCVSEGQAAKVRRAGVPTGRLVVIPNAIDAGRFDRPDPAARGELLGLFPGPVARVIGAAGRLSPEKGFEVLVEAAAIVARSDPSAGFALFGEGILRDELARRVAAAGLEGRFLLAGFRADLDRLLPHLDVLVQSSFTEGMPNVILEACAAGVPVVATTVGGTPEVIEDGWSGHLVPPGDPAALAGRILDVLGDGPGGRALGARGRDRILLHFTFEAQAASYSHLFAELVGARRAALAGLSDGVPLR
jgi:glycosyltransferase involved in cell wall biosynthesis